MRIKPRLNFGQLIYPSMHGLYHFFCLYNFSRFGGGKQLASTHLESFVWICTINDHTLKPGQKFAFIQL